LIGAGLFLTATLAHATSADVKGTDSYNALARDIFKELIEINTTDTELGNVTLAAEAVAKRLMAAGFPAEDVKVVGPNDRKKNLVARLRSTGKHKPVLLIGHLDVVEAKPEDWTTDPFKFIEKDGYFHGRGTQDMKDGDAIMTTALIRLKKEGYRGSRDIILALTADEEGGTSNGVDWLFKNQRQLVDAEFVLNHDGYSIDSQNGKALFYTLQSSEKVYADFVLTATNPGGHSSQPRRENAIYELTAGLDRLAQYAFPFELTTITRAYYDNMSKIETGAARGRHARDPADAAGCGGHRAAVRGFDRQRSATHHVRRYPFEWRACEQRASAAGAGQCELPDSAGALARGGSAGHRSRDRRSADHRAVAQRRLAAGGPRVRPQRFSAASSAARGDAAPAEAGGGVLARVAGCSGHVARRIRRRVRQRRRSHQLCGHRHRH
jgi:hypothetical protein